MHAEIPRLMSTLDDHDRRDNRYDSVISVLAVQYHISEATVRILYEHEMAKLNLESRIKSFLPTLCVRQVKEILRQNLNTLIPELKVGE